MSLATAKPRALLLVENNPYPQDFRVRREAETLESHNFDVTVIAPRGPGQSWTERAGRVSVYRFPRPPAGTSVLGYAVEFGFATLAMLLLSLWVAIRKGVDVVHAANPPDTLFVIGAALKLVGASFIFDHHDLSPEIYASRGHRAPNAAVSKALLALERCSFALADVVISTNESYKAVAIQRGKKKPESVVVVRNGPPLSFLAMTPGPRLQGRAAFLVGYVGTIGPQDGLDRWVAAVSDLVRTLGRTDFLAVVIGDGDALADMRSMIERLDLGKYFHFTGRLNEERVREVLSSVHICVQPDPSSPLNDRSTMAKTMEYMALGKPTVAFDLPETRYSAGGAALYATPNDTLEFARRVCELMDQPELCAELSRAGRQRVEEWLAWEHSIPRLLDAYRKALEPRGRLRTRGTSRSS